MLVKSSGKSPFSAHGLLAIAPFMKLIGVSRIQYIAGRVIFLQPIITYRPVSILLSQLKQTCFHVRYSHPPLWSPGFVTLFSFPFSFEEPSCVSWANKKFGKSQGKKSSLNMMFHSLRMIVLGKVLYEGLLETRRNC